MALVEVEHRLGEPVTKVVKLLSAGGLDDCVWGERGRRKRGGERGGSVAEREMEELTRKTD